MADLSLEKTTSSIDGNESDSHISQSELVLSKYRDEGVYSIYKANIERLATVQYIYSISLKEANANGVLNRIYGKNFMLRTQLGHPALTMILVGLARTLSKNWNPVSWHEIIIGILSVYPAFLESELHSRLFDILYETTDLITQITVDGETFYEISPEKLLNFIEDNNQSLQTVNSPIEP